MRDGGTLRCMKFLTAIQEFSEANVADTLTGLLVCLSPHVCVPMSVGACSERSDNSESSCMKAWKSCRLNLIISY